MKAPADVIAILKALRSKLGTLPSGLTEKNKALLRTLDDPRLLAALVQLPDKLWRAARRDLATSRQLFIQLQSALAIDSEIGVEMTTLEAARDADADCLFRRYWLGARDHSELLTEIAPGLRRLGPVPMHGVDRHGEIAQLGRSAFTETLGG